MTIEMTQDELFVAWSRVCLRLGDASRAAEGALFDTTEVAVLIYGLHSMAGALDQSVPQERQAEGEDDQWPT